MFFWDDVSPKRVAWSPDGGSLAVASTGVYLYDVHSGMLARQLKVGMEWVEEAAFSPDGKLLFTATQEGAPVWDLARGSVRWKLAGTTGARDVAVSSDGSALISGRIDGRRLWTLGR